MTSSGWMVRRGAPIVGVVGAAAVVFDLRMVPAKGGRELRFVFSRSGTSGGPRVEVIARRPPS